MLTEQAHKIVRETFENPFNKEQFAKFVRELLNKFEPAPFNHRGNLIPDAYDKYISTFERLGKYSDGENKTDILIVGLKKETSIERARTMQRNFIARYLNGSRGGELRDAAAVAFVSPDKADWRFSLVRMQYEYDAEKKKIRKELTPAKRWSFLVGANENSHTAQRQFVPLLKDDKNNPTLENLEEAFSIEKVTREFFEKYRDLFLRTFETLQEVTNRNSAIKQDFENKGVSLEDFSKKLLGQIVFLYFLQKKGWFGVPMGKSWGEGDKRFLRTLFRRAVTEGRNYFNDYLEPLFYEALAKERDDDYYSRFECRIPFLNGGLFDPISNYDWVNTFIDLPDDLFSNDRKDQKTGDIGDGILDIFDRYNFTVKEDEPLEKEVAVDPEMLGKVFENLLEVKDRKSRGTYYTPREIVHYMCEQSIINYLAKELEGKVSTPDLEQLLKYGEAARENEARVENEGRETNTYYYKLPESIRKNAKGIDSALAHIKVCDPAIGSGAFPVGIMHEIVKARLALNPYLCEGQLVCEGRTPYDFKFECIHNSIYGVDIDPGAVEIAKLRLWLSLVVDESDIRQIKPLPNLDYKIMQGNSLLEEYEGVKLFDETMFSSADKGSDREIEDLKRRQSDLQSEYFKLNSRNKLMPDKEEKFKKELKIIAGQLKKLNESRQSGPVIKDQMDSFSTANEKSAELKRLHEEFFESTQKKKKDELKKRIEAMEWDLIEATLREQDKISALEKLEQFKKSNIKPFFLWKLHFADVFEEKGGFDVVIANPPYVRADSGIEHLALRQAIIESKQYETLWEKWDLFVPFIELCYKLLKPDGVTTMIVSDAYCHSKYAQKSQNWFLRNSRILRLDFLSKIKVFEAGVHNIVYFYQKGEGSNNKPERREHEDEFGKIKVLPTDEQKNLTYRAFSPQEQGQNITGILLEEICYITYGLRPSSDEHEAKGEFVTADLVSEKRDSIHCKPYVEGKHLNNWYCSTHLWIEWGTERAPARFCRPTFPELYLIKEKLLAQRSPGPDPVACYDDEELVFTPASVGFILWHNLSGVRNNSLRKTTRYKGEKPSRPDLPKREELEKTSRRFGVKYLLAVINASVARDFLRSNRRSNIHLYPDDWKKLPIPDVPPEKQTPIVELVDHILTAKKNDPNADISALEKQIDEMVYALYGLTPDGIGIVENSQ